MSIDVPKQKLSARDQRLKPRFLYRYFDAWGADAVANLELKITPPNRFNDPFEFMPCIEQGIDDARTIRKRAMVDPEIRETNPGLTEENVRDTFPFRAKELLWRTRFQRLASASFGVLCLSRRPDEITMWAHYAENHTGLVLELDMESFPFSEFLSPEKGTLLQEVRYLSPQLRSCYSISDLDDRQKLPEILKACASEKALGWSVEEEFRLLVPLSSPPFVTMRHANGSRLYFLQLRESAINRIILGARRTPEFELRVRVAARRRGIEDRIWDARLDLRNYKVFIERRP